MCGRHLLLEGCRREENTSIPGLTVQCGRYPLYLSRHSVDDTRVSPSYFDVRTLLCSRKRFSRNTWNRRKVTMGKLLGRLPGEISRLLEGRPV